MPAGPWDLVVPPGPGHRDVIVVPAGELTERFSRSSGPGGQSVNTADSRVEVVLDIAQCTVFTDLQRSRLMRQLTDAVLTVVASEHRSQYQNRRAARERLAAVLADALRPPPPARRATRPSRGARERRIQAKKRRSSIKQNRGRVDPD